MPVRPLVPSLPHHLHYVVYAVKAEIVLNILTGSFVQAVLFVEVTTILILMVGVYLPRRARKVRRRETLKALKDLGKRRIRKGIIREVVLFPVVRTMEM